MSSCMALFNNLSHILLFSNGYERSGLVCVLLNELERMKRDQGHINIVQSVKLMKERNENIIPSFVSISVLNQSRRHINTCIYMARIMVGKYEGEHR